MATLNELAQGRIIIGMSVGFSRRNMPPVRLARLREEIGVIRELLAGEEADYRGGECERGLSSIRRSCCQSS